MFVYTSHKKLALVPYPREKGGSRGFKGGTVVKNLPADMENVGSVPELRISPWSRKWQPTPVFLPGKIDGQNTLTGYSPWGCKRVRT